MKTLALPILRKIERKIRDAEELYFFGDFSDAMTEYKAALDMIPEPKHSWNESWTLFYGISEMYFKKKQYLKALEYLKETIMCSNAIGNPQIHLRIGQIRYELNQLDKAKDELMRAYMGGDVEIFENENPKYYNFIKPYI